jgi:hypothetical protein
MHQKLIFWSASLLNTRKKIGLKKLLLELPAIQLRKKILISSCKEEELVGKLRTKLLIRLRIRATNSSIILGHGEKNLHTVFMLLMMLAFLVDQIQEAVCGPFKAGLENMRSRTRFWKKMRSRFDSYFIDSWEDLLRSLGSGFKGSKLSFDTS